MEQLNCQIFHVLPLQYRVFTTLYFYLQFDPINLVWAMHAIHTRISSLSRIYFHLQTYDFQQHNLFCNLFHLNNIFFSVDTYLPIHYRNSIFAISIYDELFIFMHYPLTHHPQEGFISIQFYGYSYSLLLLVSMSGMLLTGQWVSESVSE